jgi:hypothetical protein
VVSFTLRPIHSLGRCSSYPTNRPQLRPHNRCGQSGEVNRFVPTENLSPAPRPPNRNQSLYRMHCGLSAPCLNGTTNFMELSPTRGPIICAARIHKSFPLVPTLSYSNPVHPTAFYLCKIHLNVIHPPRS